VPLGLDNIALPSDATRRKTYEAANQSSQAAGDSARHKWRVGELEFEALMRRLENAVRNKCIAVCKVATPLRELTCHMGSHRVTCHLAELTFPPLPQPKLVLD